MPRGNRGKKAEQLKFYQKLILNRYLLRVFGVEKFDDLAKYLREPRMEEILNDGSTAFFKEITKSFGTSMEISREQLAQYDLNIVSCLQKINAKRAVKIKLKYFQYLTLLFVEYYLDMFFHHKDKLLGDLNSFRLGFIEEYSEIESITVYTEKDLNKVALWNATGSGKTILMHINYFQYQYYAGRLPEGSSFILLTPKEDLSKQHLADYAESDIPSEIYNKSFSRGFAVNRNAVQILENTKLAARDGDKTVAVSRFGSSNCVFVDEGHRGASGDTWYKFRNQLCENGFSFEYSATFGQAVAASNDKDLLSEYSKCILFDYSYKFFYSDGYGKDYNIINLQDDSHLDLTRIYLTACLMTYYQQKKLFLDKKDAFKDFNIENPLMVFVGSSVNAVSKKNGRDTSDVVDILLFFDGFIKDKGTSIQHIKRVMEHTTGLLDEMSRDIFRNSFAYLTSLHLSSEELYDDILKTVFNSSSNASIMHIENLKGVQGEISLRLGENEPFGLINVGDDNALMKLCQETGFSTGSVDFRESLFEKITESNSKINLLIGSKKFTEGWNCWRVSTMGLMNVGKSEGSEIIQLFGRGVRLKGYGMSLMRSSAFVRMYRELNVEVPPFISTLETLNVFGVKAEYMKRFKEYLEKEGVPTSKDAPHIISMPIIRNKRFRAKKLYSLQLKAGLEYKKDAKKPTLQYMEGLTVELDCYGKIQFESSRDRHGVILEKEEGKLQKQHFAMINLDQLFLMLERYKAEKLRHNLIITKEGILSLLEHDDWYRLFIPAAELRIASFSDYDKYERILETLLKLYCDKFYNVSRSRWEHNYLEYRVVDDEYESFIEGNEYLIAINDTEENQELISFIEELKDEVATAKKNRQLIDYADPQRKGSFELFTFANSLYNPLLYLQKGEKEIVISPTALVDSEKDFVLDLRNYVKNHAEMFNGKELFLIRNKSKKGVGFFETAGFYPDFIMWIVDGEKQYITFIEPHGMMHEAIDSEKVQLFRKIKDIQANMGNPNVILNSAIVTPTDFGFVDRAESEWNSNHVFFMRENYIEKLLSAILN